MWNAKAFDDEAHPLGLPGWLVIFAPINGTTPTDTLAVVAMIQTPIPPLD